MEVIRIVLKFIHAQENNCFWESIFVFFYHQEMQLQNEDVFYEKADLVGKVHIGMGFVLIIL